LEYIKGKSTQSFQLTSPLGFREHASSQHVGPFPSQLVQGDSDSCPVRGV
ncbi:hypothetical protein K443DRAFT_90856, partial [Laccaria amethystina LaAM-08-1]